MKPVAALTLVLAVLLGSFCGAFAEQAISPQEAGKYAGKPMVVCGKVAGVQYLRPRMGEPTYIHFEGPGPAFSVVVMGLDKAKFGMPLEDLYDGKDICVSGLITKTKSRYQMDVREPFQIQIKQ